MEKNNPIKNRNHKLAAKVVQALKTRRFEAYYAATRQEAIKKLLDLIPKRDVVSWGGSSTAQELKIKELLKKHAYQIIDRDSAATPEERWQLQREALLCDTFIMSSNAVSEDGELVNIDRAGNRAAALIYGPRQIIVLAGMNKISKTLADAQSRAQNTAAPINAQRFPELKTPCAATGSCAGCTGEDCLCSHTVITRMCYPAGRIKVILIGENLGY